MVRYITDDVLNEIASNSIIRYSRKGGRWTIETVELETQATVRQRLYAITIMNDTSAPDTFYALSTTDSMKMLR